jgi:hypothetical protein
VIILTGIPGGPRLCEVEGCRVPACYLLTFGDLSKTFCEHCLARRVVELLVFD